MSAIVLLDTTIYLNVLDVPGLNQDRASVLVEFQRCIEGSDYFLLPLATVWETGNHISHLGDGQTRRRYAQALLHDVTLAFNGDLPYTATHFPAREEFLVWLRDFPEIAMRNKAVNKPGEGISLADLSIIKEWQQNCVRHPMTQVRIWSLDGDLASYDRRP